MSPPPQGAEPSPGDSTGTVRALSWAVVGRGFERALGLARVVVLARLLSPEDFGEFGLALLLLAVLENFSRAGLDMAVIQRKGNVTAYLDTVWTVQVVRALVLAGLVLLLAEPVAGFLGEPGAVPLFRWVALAVAVGGLANVGMLLFQRALDMKSITTVTAVAGLADTVVAVGAAFAWRDPAALGAGLVARNAALVVTSYLVHPLRPRLRLEWARVRDLSDYGRHVFYQSMIYFLLEQGDDAVVVLTSGAGALGLYQMAYRLATMATVEVWQVVTQVAFPAYARIQDDLPRLREGLERALRATAAVAFPLAVGLALLASPAVRVILGPDWTEMVPALMVLCIFGLMKALGSVFDSLLMARGVMVPRSVISTMQLVLMGALIFPLTARYSILGAALAVTLAQAVGMVSSIVVGSRRVGVGPGLLARALATPALATLGMGAALVGWTAAFPFGSDHAVVALGTEVVVGALAYLGVVVVAAATWDPAAGQALRLVLRIRGRGRG